MSNRSPQFARRIVAGYLAAQALSTMIWWICLTTLPWTLIWFQPENWPDEALLSFWLPDFSLIVIGSMTAAWAVLHERPWASMAVWMIAGAAGYATLYCIGCSLATGQAWIAAAMMTCMAGLTLAMATIHGHPHQSPATFRTTTMSRSQAFVWSILQLVIFWCTFLWILPMGLWEFQRRALQVESFVHIGQRPLAITLFVFASAVGMSSCLTIAFQGGGTPLPTANAPKLVVAGPYRFVRNPMALAGIVQGISIGWLLGSWLVIAYALLGAFVWHCFVMPVEEAEMQARFGSDYSDYQRAVGLWIPIRKEPFR